MSIKKYKESVASSAAKMKKAGKNLEKGLPVFFFCGITQRQNKRSVIPQ